MDPNAEQKKTNLSEPLNNQPDQPTVTSDTNATVTPENQLPNGSEPVIISPTAGPATTVEPTNDPATPAPADNPDLSSAETAPVFAPKEDVTTVAAPAIPAAAPAAVVGGISTPSESSKKGLPKAAIFGVAGVILLAILGAGYYFGYYTNSSLVYSQALSNTGKGLTELTNQLTAKNMADYKGYTGSGTYKYSSDSYSTDGKMAFKSDKSNYETTFDVGLGVTRLDFVVRAMKSASTNPDIYFKANGLNGLGAMVGPEYGALAATYNDKWIVVDHTLLDNLQKGMTASSANAAPTSEQVIDEITAFSKVNEKYLYSADPETSVTTVLETYGQKTVDGHKVIHYKVGFNKPNVKKYITAQHDALKTSKLNDWIKQNNYTESVESSHQELLKSADKIKTTDTFDMYADIDNRVIYKLRFSETKNPALNYVDVGLDYQGGDELPFFIAGKSEENKADFNLKINANTETNVINLALNANSPGEDNMKVSSTFTFKPTKDAVAITAPANAKQIADVFAELGLGDPLSGVSAVGETLGVSTSAKKQ